MMKNEKKPILVAHRGYPKRYPENSLPGVEAALQAGARFIEIDVQLTADRVPVLFHDEELTRTTGNAGTITEITMNQVRLSHPDEGIRLEDRFENLSITPLVEFVELIKNRPQVICFIEMKEESLKIFGVTAVTIPVMETLKPIQQRCIPISKNTAAIEFTRKLGATSIGMILRQYDQTALDTAIKLAPDFLFCNHKKISPGLKMLWPGPWKWVLYEVTDPELALTWASRGADFIETMEIGEMLEHPSLKKGS